MFGIISSVLSGGLTGVIGSIATNVLNYFNQKQKNKHELEVRKFELATMDKEKEYMLEEAKVDMEITKTKVEGAIDLEEAKAFTSSQGWMNTSLLPPTFIDRLMASEKPFPMFIAGCVAFIFGIVDFIKHLMRPGITIVLCIVFINVLYMTYGIMEDNKLSLDVEKAYSIFILCIDAVVYLTTMCIGWWFSDRRVSKFMMRLNDGNIKK